MENSRKVQTWKKASNTRPSIRNTSNKTRHQGIKNWNQIIKWTNGPINNCCKIRETNICTRRRNIIWFNNERRKKKGINNLEFNNIMSQDFLNLIDRIIFQKWYTKITIKIDREYEFTTIALVDSGADTNCIQEGIISN